MWRFHGSLTNIVTVGIIHSISSGTAQTSRVGYPNNHEFSLFCASLFFDSRRLDSICPELLSLQAIQHSSLPQRHPAMTPARRRSTSGRPGSVLLVLQYRDRLSLGENRARLGFAAFHWSIAVRYDEYHRFDVTDGIVQDKFGNDINPERNWLYRHQVSTTLTEITRHLGAIKIGQVSRKEQPQDLELLFKTSRCRSRKQIRSRIASAGHEMP